MPDLIHVITPGDHYSPRTGSATSTVAHGLSAAAQRDGWGYRPFVVLDASTMRPRYDSATPIEYDGVPGPSRRERLADVALGRVGLPRRAAARYFRPAADAIAERKPAIVLAHNAPVLAWLLRDTPHRVVLYAHNDLLGTYTKSEAARMLGGVAAIVAVSDSLAAQLARSLPRPLVDRLHVVRNGVDCEVFTPAPGPRSVGPLRILFLGRMISDKGPDVLLRAAAMLGRDDLEFAFVGSVGFDRNAAASPYEVELRRLAADAGPNVTFEPFVDRASVPEIFRGADVFVVPSRWADPCPLTAGEGLASGLAVVASRIGGIPEVVGSAGRYVSPDDPDALAAAIAELVDDPALRQRLGAAARQRALEHDWSWAWANLRAVLDRL
ncbi:glycosyltransferase family 4 protein [Agromyces sp. NPDC057865]|uniref:glycosyltransferase family 4 protein n=1 Tax=Agromyces sp. NPDC057865 TaxID=3346267 RepID=UPI00366F292B